MTVLLKQEKKKVDLNSLVDFINKMDLSAINKSAVECLIKAGALDNFNVYRSKNVAVHEKIIDSISSDKKRNIDGQISLIWNFRRTEESRSKLSEYQRI